METNKAINMAVGCVMASELEMKEKQKVIGALRKIETDAQELKHWCQVAKDVLPEEEFNLVQEAYDHNED